MLEFRMILSPYRPRIARVCVPADSRGTLRRRTPKGKMRRAERSRSFAAVGTRPLTSSITRAMSAAVKSAAAVRTRFGSKYQSRCRRGTLGCLIPRPTISFRYRSSHSSRNEPALRGTVYGQEILLLAE